MASSSESSTERKVALITGATGGIGRATAVALAKTGEFDLALHFNNASEETRQGIMSAIAAERGSAGTSHAFFKADLGNYDDVRKLHEKVVKSLGHVDVLFNNAGANAGHTGVQDLIDLPFEAFEESWRINTGSGILLTQLCLPHMEEQGWGRIIFDSSVAAFTGGFVGPHYASSKSAQHGFIHWLANNVAKKGITVNAVAPALIGGTNMMGDEEGPGLKDRVARSKLTWHGNYSQCIVLT